MRCLERNKRNFEYLPYEGMGSDLNEFGEHTGDFSDEGPQYGNPVQYRGNISVPSGKVNQTFYGEDIRYTHTLVMDNPKADIKEHGLIRWNGELYDIQAVRPSLNALSVALRKRTTSNNDPYIPDEPVEPVEPDGEEP